MRGRRLALVVFVFASSFYGPLYRLSQPDKPPTSLPAPPCYTFPPYLHQMSDGELWEVVEELYEACAPPPPSIPLITIPEPSLPQYANVTERKERREAVNRASRLYRFTFNSSVPQAPKLASPVPKAEDPSSEWMKETTFVFLRTFVDTELALIRALVEDPRKWHELFRLLFPPTLLHNFTRATSFGEFDKMYTQLPTAASEWPEDPAFARYQLAGVDPTAIEACTREHLAKANLASLPEEARKGVEEAFDTGRLYVTDYTAQSHLPTGLYPTVTKSYAKFATGPLAFFAVPKDEEVRERQWLLPLAVQSDSTRATGSKLPPMFHPGDGRKWTWAKAVVNSAAATRHQSVVHLVWHLVMESACVSTRRTIPPAHPLHHLLVPHCIGTNHINELAVSQLLNRGGPVDQLFPFNISALDAEVGKAVRSILTGDFSFPVMLQQRGMDRFAAPYPYRDDGLLVWSAIRKWVASYLKVYYGKGEEADRALMDDYELQAWVKELRSDRGGCMSWLDHFDGKLETLTTFVSALIFTASSGHASVNYPQAGLESYTPAYPLSLYGPPPATRDQQISLPDLLVVYPPLEMAKVQKSLGSLLGGVQHTRLGDYPKGHFRNDSVASAHREFQQELLQVEATIEKRNEGRVAAWEGYVPAEVAQHWAYPYLLPSKTPQSINI